MAERALIFDLDGTIWRGHEWYASVLSDAFGIDAATTSERLADGANLFGLAKEAGLSRERLIAACCSRASSLALYDGVLGGLEQISANGWKLGIVTSLSERIAGPALANLGIDSFFRTKKFAARKPSPSSLLTALSDLGETSDRRHCYVGDTAADAGCAARAGVTFAWASYGYGVVEPTTQMKVLREFRDVLSV